MEELTIQKIAEKLSKTRKIVTIHRSKLNDLTEYLNMKYTNWKCKYMMFGQTVHITRKNKFN